MLIVFGFDNVMSWIQHPIIFYPIMMVGSVIALLYSMGLGGVMIPVARQTINLTLRNINVGF
jgi:hypothetical protein